MVENYKKGLDIAPLIRKMEDVDLKSKEPISPKVTGTRAPIELTKKIYELKLEKNMDRADILEYNITKLFSLLWGHCTEALHQGLRGHEDFEDNDISFYAKWLLHQIKLTTQGIKEERHSNPYQSFYTVWLKWRAQFQQNTLNQTCV